MNKNPKTLKDRAAYIKDSINKRHKSLNIEEIVSKLAKELFLSEATIWKDFSKT